MWHSNSLTASQINLIVRMLTKWPTHFCFPALDLCRIALLHPSIERYMLDEREITSNNNNDKVLTQSEKLCVAILEHAERAVTANEEKVSSIADRNSTLALRCCVNLFKFRSLWKISLLNMENLLNICKKLYTETKIIRNIQFLPIHRIV